MSFCLHGVHFWSKYDDDTRVGILKWHYVAVGQRRVIGVYRSVACMWSEAPFWRKYHVVLLVNELCRCPQVGQCHNLKLASATISLLYYLPKVINSIQSVLYVCQCDDVQATKCRSVWVGQTSWAFAKDLGFSRHELSVVSFYTHRVSSAAFISLVYFRRCCHARTKSMMQSPMTIKTCARTFLSEKTYLIESSCLTRCACI